MIKTFQKIKALILSFFIICWVKEHELVLHFLHGLELLLDGYYWNRVAASHIVSELKSIYQNDSICK